MKHSSFWTVLLENMQKRAPLRFVHGMRSPVKPGVCCTYHSHRVLEIVHHPSGRGITRLEKGRQMAFREGDTVIYAPEVLHDQVMDNSGQDWCIQIAVPSLALKKKEGVLVVPQVGTIALAHDLEFLSSINRPPTRAEQSILNLRATAVLMELLNLAHLIRDEERLEPTERHVRKAEQYITERYGEIASLHEVAAATGIGYDHLRHSFKERRGKSLIRQLNEVRVERARALLIHSRLPLKQISATCGFRDEYYFSAVFRKFTGMAPGRYRDNWK